MFPTWPSALNSYQNWNQTNVQKWVDNLAVQICRHLPLHGWQCPSKYHFNLKPEWPLLLNLISDNQLSTPLPLRLRPPSPPLPLCLIHFRRVQFRRIVNQEYHHLVRTLTGGCGDQVIRAVKTETVLLHKAWREDRHSMATVILKTLYKVRLWPAVKCSRTPKV